MSVRTKAHRTDAVCTMTFVGPLTQAQAARQALDALGFEEVRETVPWREAFAGARQKENLTQIQLARLTGIPQRHISEMEHGKRPIGKERAKKLAEALKIDYHVFL